jgi:hypothetical protein
MFSVIRAPLEILKLTSNSFPKLKICCAGPGLTGRSTQSSNVPSRASGRRLVVSTRTLTRGVEMATTKLEQRACVLRLVLDAVTNAESLSAG